MGNPVTVLIVDDHDVVRRGVRAFLETEPDLVVVGEACSGAEAVALSSELVPDVVLMDLVLPEMSGIDAIRRIVSSRPESRILVLTSFGSDDLLFPAIKAGALGYLLKDAGPEELASGIRHAARGESCLAPEVAKRLVAELAHEAASTESIDPLTHRELEVLQHLARGLTNDQIASRLFISEATVRTHVSHILAKLGLSNRTQAALHALRQGLASLDDPDA